MSLKKRFRPGRLECSPDRNAIVVHFTTEITHFDEVGLPLRVEKSLDKREISVGRALRSLRQEDIPAVAQEIVTKCRYIPKSKTSQVEEILGKLSGLSGAVATPTTRSGDGSWECSVSPVLATRWAEVLPRATIDKIDEYVDELYEEAMELKAHGAQCILRLCIKVRLLEEISEHSLLLGVLSRELRENAKRSYELAVAITGIFACLTHFSQFHALLLQHQCTDATMRVVDYESRRRAVLDTEMEDLQARIAARGSQETPEERLAHEQEDRRHRLMAERQDRLLQLCLVVLRNFSEETVVERKLVAQHICQLLLPLLGRSNEDLLITTLGFLLKLVVFEDNKNQVVAQMDALTKLADLTVHPSMDITLLALRVVFNVTFDPRARSILSMQTGLLSALATTVQRPAAQKVALKVMYHISIDMPTRSIIAARHPGCIVMALQLLSRCPGTLADQDVAAFCVNLATDEGCANHMVEADRFPHVVLRAAQNGDPMLLKLVRHVSGHQALQARMLTVMKEDVKGDEWLHETLSLAKASSDNTDVRVEALGILGNFYLPEHPVPWLNLCERGLLELLHRLLIVGFVDDDVLLECIRVTSAVALNSQSMPLLAASKIPFLLPTLLTEKQDDGDIVVQLLFALRCLLLEEDTCEVLLQETDMPTRVLDIVREGGWQQAWAMPAIQVAAEETLDLILAVDMNKGRRTRWTEEIRSFRFQSHNHEWCERLQWPTEVADSKAQTLSARQTGLRWRDASTLECWGNTLGNGNSLS